MKHGWLPILLLSTVAAIHDVKAIAVLQTFPARGTVVPSEVSLSIVFDRPVNPATLTASSFRVFGRNSGRLTGTLVTSANQRVVTLLPDRDLFHGEIVLVNLSHAIAGTDGSPLRGAGYAFSFQTRLRPSAMIFDPIDVLDVHRAIGDPPTVYGAISSDFNGDGWVDLGTINERSQDLRMFLNQADGTGLFDDFLTPTTPLGLHASPNEPADFDNDGKIDACAANDLDGTVSILLGLGDGSFMPQQVIATGPGVRGIAVLDTDGDADLDIVSANTGTNDLSLMLNNGSGVFGAPAYFDSGGSGEYALASADMNGDGIVDLITGLRTQSAVVVLLGNGNGTFTALPQQAAGGRVVSIVPGDVNGDHRMDLSIASENGQCAILFGNGNGTLQPPDVEVVLGNVPAADLGDVDGDGDLDWMLSIFGTKKWLLYLNDGQGQFTFDREFGATGNPSCAVLADLDHDGDTDLALVDETENVIQLHRSVPAAGDGDGDGTSNGTDCAPADPGSWRLPAEVGRLDLFHAGGVNGTTTLLWQPLSDPGASAVAYDLLRATQRNALAGGVPASCIQGNGDAVAFDSTPPAPIFYYVVRARNGCGGGPLGFASSGTPRFSNACP